MLLLGERTMSDVGVFRANNGSYYTCCCRAFMPNDYENCPRCKRKVISLSERYEFTTGTENQALKGRLQDQYRWSGRENAARIDARLRGEYYVQPHLCSECCWPIDECKCWEAYQSLRRKRKRK